jgi:hypothetical protein
MRPARLLAVVCAVLSAGCFTSDSVIVVQPDGSGTVTNTILLKSATLELLKSAQPFVEAEKGGAAKEGTASAKEFFSEARMREATASMGEGVTFKSMEPLRREGWEGVNVVYAFKDISKLKYNMRAESAVAPTDSSSPELLTFKFTPGAAASPSKLTIVLPLEKALKERSKTTGQMPKMDDSPMGKAMMEQFKTMFEGLRASVAVEVAGPIVKTNADYVSGSKVTLLAIDFNQMMASGADFEMFGAISDGTIPLAEAREKLKTTKGLSMQLQPEVNVEFGRK